MTAQGFLTARLPVELLERLEDEAEDNDRSRSAELRVALEKHLAHRKQEQAA